MCPTDTSDHLGIPASPAAWAVAIDALDHPGHPADLSRVHPSQPCIEGAMSGLTPSQFLSGEEGVVTPIPGRLQEGQANREPPLRCYVFGSCPSAR